MKANEFLEKCKLDSKNLTDLQLSNLIKKYEANPVLIEDCAIVRNVDKSWISVRVCSLSGSIDTEPYIIVSLWHKKLDADFVSSLKIGDMVSFGGYTTFTKPTSKSYIICSSLESCELTQPVFPPKKVYNSIWEQLFAEHPELFMMGVLASLVVLLLIIASIFKL